MVPPSEPLILVMDKWLANCAGKNADRTVTTKTYHIRNFLDLMFRKVASVDPWLAEHENTDYKKQRAIRSFKARQVSKSHVSADIDINAITKKLLTDYKGLLGSGADPQSAKTIDNKIESLSDFMNYAIGTGLYTLSRDNPTDGLRIQNKKARIQTRSRINLSQATP